MVEWRVIEGYENYEDSNDGRIRSLPHTCIYTTRHGKKYERDFPGKELSIKHLSRGFQHVMLSKGPKAQHVHVHVVVAKAFVPNPNSYEFIRHIDGNRCNNFADNLEWVEKREWNEKPKPKAVRSAYVYFIRSKLAVKIGVATDVDKRLSILQTGNPEQLSVVKKVRFTGKDSLKNAYKAEKAFHQKFDESRLVGEWFDAHVLHAIAVNNKHIRYVLERENLWEICDLLF